MIEGAHIWHTTPPHTHITCCINCVVSWVAIPKSESQCDRRRRRRIRLIFKIFWWLIGNWILTRTWCGCCFVSFPLINWLPPSPSSTSSKFDLSRVVTFIFSSFSCDFHRTLFSERCSLWLLLFVFVWWKTKLKPLNCVIRYEFPTTKAIEIFGFTPQMRQTTERKCVCSVAKSSSLAVFCFLFFFYLKFQFASMRE